MKLLILDLYRLTYRITNNSKLAIVIALVYVTFLNLIFTYGLGMLLPYSVATTIINYLFKFPIYILTAIGMFLVNVWIMAPLKNIKKEKNLPYSYWGILMYTGVALIFYAYTQISN